MVDDLFDVLEGDFDQLCYLDEHLTELVEPSRVMWALDRSRAAVAMLTSLMRQQIAWTPAEDGHEATVWRSRLLAGCDPSGELGRILARELDELVALATPGARRPLPERGTFESLARRAHVDRYWCVNEARGYETLEDGWEACDRVEPLFRIPFALGIEPRAIVNRVVGVVPQGDLLERMLDPDTTAPLDCEGLLHGAASIVPIAVIRETLTTPELYERLAAERGA